MNSLASLTSNVLKGIVSIGQKRVASKNPAEPLKDGRFDYIAEAKSDSYTVGFGKCIMLPNDINKRKYFIAGYSENNPAKGVIDPQYAHAVWIDDNSGHGGILFISLDIVGLLNKDVNELKTTLSDFSRLTGCRNISVFATHNHAGIDTMGIWGKLPFSGKSPKFMNILFKAVKKAAFAAYEERKPGKLYHGTVEVPDMQEDIRLPLVYSKTLTRLRFVPNDGSRETYIINFASHSESLQGCNSLVSADFPCYLREQIRSETGAETFYCVGAIGGMISMNISNEKLYREENRLLESTRSIGKKLAEYALSINNEKELKPKISIITQEFYCPVENPVLIIACQIGILNADRYSIPGSNSLGALKTEITYLEIDSLKLLQLPCELFPELAYGGYLSDEESAEGKGPEINPTPLAQIAKDHNLVIIGLANDELGYVLPPNDFLLNSQSPYLEKAVDRHSRRHYEETNSLGPQTAAIIADVFGKIIDTVNTCKENIKTEALL